MESPEHPDDDPVFVSMTLNDGSQHNVNESFILQAETLYPSADVRQELRSMAGWLIGNPKRRKTKSGVKRFIHSWLSRAHDKGGVKPGRSPTKYSDTTRHNIQVAEEYLKNKFAEMDAREAGTHENQS